MPPAPWRWGRLRSPGVLACACVAVLAVPFAVQAQFDPDFWWHVLVGDRVLDGSFPRSEPFTFTAAGHAFIVQEWGSETLFALLMHAGVVAVALVMGAVTLGGLWVAVLRARRHTASPEVLALLGALGLVVGISVFGPRPQMFTFALSAVALWLLDRHRAGRPRVVWWLVPLFAVWGNLHGGFSLGLGLVLVVVVADVAARVLGLDGAPTARVVTREAAALGLSALAVLVNPNGFGVYRYAGGLVSNPVAQSNLQEWRSPDFHDPTFIPLAVVVALLVIVGPRARRADLADALVAAAGVVLSLYAVRNLSIVVVTAMPLLAAGLEEYRASLVARRAGARPAAGLAAAFVALVLATVVALSAALTVRNLSDDRNDPNSGAYAGGVAGALCDAPSTRLFQPFGSAGWLLYELDRGLDRRCAHDTVFAYGEVQAIGPQVLRDYLDTAAAGPGTAAVLDGYGVQTVWQGRGSPLARWLDGRSGWVCVFADTADVVYTRADAEAAWRAPRDRCPG